MKKTVKCPTCGHEREVEACEACDGSGLPRLPPNVPDETYPFSLGNCPECDGTGIQGGRVIVTI